MNYFIYNGRNYYYILTDMDIVTFIVPINDDYEYKVIVFGYHDLTSKEDLESILYFKVIQ